MSAHARLIEVRPIENRDQSTWLNLWNGYLEFYETTLPLEQTELTWNRLQDSDYNLHGLVAVSEGHIVGIAHYLFTQSSWAMVDYCYLEDLYVDQNFRGAGAGRSLIDAVIVAARAKMSGRVYWSTKESNTRARVLYERLIKTPHSPHGNIHEPM
jgi:GNAT superfamily N-acetyltransferase